MIHQVSAHHNDISPAPFCVFRLQIYFNYCMITWWSHGLHVHFTWHHIYFTWVIQIPHGHITIHNVSFIYQCTLHVNLFASKITCMSHVCHMVSMYISQKLHTYFTWVLCRFEMGVTYTSPHATFSSHRYHHITCNKMFPSRTEQIGGNSLPLNSLLHQVPNRVTSILLCANAHERIPRDGFMGMRDWWISFY